MQLGSASSLMWLLLAIPIVICYMLKVRPRRVSVPSVILWEEVFDERKPRAIWQRLRHVLSLLIQLLFLLLVALALSNPLFSWQLEQTRTIALVIDDSASMLATDVAPNRLASAKGEAIKLIHGLRQGENMAIISAAEPRVEIGFNDHPRLLNRSVDQIRGTEAPARLAEAISLAHRLVEGRDNGQIIILSDQAPTEVALADIDDRRVHLVTVGSGADNLAITQFRVRRNLDDRIAFQVLVSVDNFGDSPADVQLELKLGDQLLDVLPLKLESDEQWQSVLEYTSADGGTIAATIDHEDALACDNRAVAELTPRQIQPVILVSPGSFFLENVLASIPQVAVRTSPEIPATIPKGTILVVHRTALDQVPKGMVFCIDPLTDSDLWSLGPPVSDPVVSQQDEASPLMSHLQLAEIAFPARRLTITEPHQVLARTLDGSAVFVAVSGSASRVLLLSTDLERGDLPMRTAFPILMNNAIAWFQGQSGELQPALSTGQTTQIALTSRAVSPDGGVGALVSNKQVQSFELVAPDGRRRPVMSSGGVATIGPLDQCGVWELQSIESYDNRSDPVVRRIACNLANIDESDVRVEPQINPLVPAGAWMSRPAWIYLVLLALALISAEWFLYQRRWIT